MLTASDPRPGPNRPPYESEPAQKLIKEKRPTHTPVGYQAISLQVIYCQCYRPINHAETPSTRDAELHRSRCNARDFPVQDVRYVAGLYPLPHPPINGNELKKEKSEKRAVKLCSVEPTKNQQVTDKTAKPHRNCEAVNGFYEAAGATPELLLAEPARRLSEIRIGDIVASCSRGLLH